MSYAQLTREQRYQIKVLLDTKIPQWKIAVAIGTTPSTISRELKRNRGKRGYRPSQAHKKALIRRQKKIAPRIKAEVWVLAEKQLREDWSPEQVSGKLRESGIFLSHERI